MALHYFFPLLRRFCVPTSDMLFFIYEAVEGALETQERKTMYKKASLRYTRSISRALLYH